MRAAVAATIMAACCLQFAMAGEGFGGAWKTQPAPQTGGFVAEFFDDGTVATIDSHGVFTLNYRKSKNPKSFEVYIGATEAEPRRHYANFDLKSDRVALFTIL